MSEQTRRRIFEAFFTTKQVTGTGLGLWVSYEIIRKHSGRFGVRSRQGAHSGAVFTVFLPDDGLVRGRTGAHDEATASHALVSLRAG